MTCLKETASLSNLRIFESRKLELKQNAMSSIKNCLVVLPLVNSDCFYRWFLQQWEYDGDLVGGLEHDFIFYVYWQ